MFILDIFYLSFKNLWRRKLRSWLTILGIIIGISSVIALVSISVGMQKAIEELLSKMGKDRLIIFPGKQSIIPGTLFIGKPFTEKEVDHIKKLPSVEAAVPFTFTSATIEYNREKEIIILNAVPVDASENLGSVGYELLDGRTFKKVDRGKCVAILGYLVAKRVFSKEIEVGDKIKINGLDCKAVGIFKPTGSRLDDYSVIIPLSTLKERFGIADIKMIIVKAKDIDKAKKDIERTLKKTRGDNFNIMTMGQMTEYAKQTLGLISVIVIAIACISLVVSGIGIMNTMYMAVTERTKEIGLLKALGAKKFEIALLFLFESGLLGMFGGIIGCLIGITGAELVEYFASLAGYSLFRAYIEPTMIVFAIIFSFVVGILSGLAPSLSAAKLDPVRALRYE